MSKLAAVMAVLLGGAATAEAAGVRDLALGWESGCAILDDGALSCWGSRAPSLDSVHLDRPTRIPAPPDLVDVATSDGVTCVVDRAGAVHCTGNDGKRAPGGSGESPRSWAKIPTLPPAVAVDVSRSTACALTRAGEVHCWGDNDWGGAPGADGGEPAKVAGLAGIEEIAIGTYGSCARARDGRVACWGSVSYQSPPVNQAEVRLRWMKVPRARLLRMGDDSACIMTTSSAVHCWGSGGDGRDQAVVVKPPAGAVDLAVGIDICVLLKDGRVACKDWPAVLPYTGAPDRGDAFGIIPGVAGAARVEVGEHAGCAVDKAGALSCWGGDELVPVRADREQPTPVAVVGLRGVTAIDTREKTSCAIAAGNLFCWGGDAGDDGRPHQVAGVSEAIEVRVGANGACARVAGGRVACFSLDHGGRPLRGTGEQGDDPIRGASLVPGISGTTSVAVSARHACALRSGGDLVCWGMPQPGLFGSGDDPVGVQPVTAFGRAASLAAAGDRTCAIRRDDGAVLCIGGNDDPSPPLGHGKPTGSARPVQVRGARDVAQLHIGRGVACVRGRMGTVACWGEGALVPVPWTGIADAVGVAAGAEPGGSSEGTQACVVRRGGELRCGLPGNHRAILPDAIAVSAGDMHFCALRRGGTVACWGYRDDGALGDGTGDTIMPAIPVPL